MSGIQRIRTTPYHLSSNGMVESLHRTLKQNLRCHDTKWTESLPFVNGNKESGHRRGSVLSIIWPILQILNGPSTVCKDPDTVLIKVESMIESTTDSNEFQSKDETVVRIPDAHFNITPESVTKYTTPCSSCIRAITISVNNQGLIGGLQVLAV
ncbi:hypothetical protein TNCV_1498521 [Trichonephila clavipes]|nr:hypothetical protein TNCV_1498521 [Trichonephila clavipes]